MKREGQQTTGNMNRECQQTTVINQRSSAERHRSFNRNRASSRTSTRETRLDDMRQMRREMANCIISYKQGNRVPLSRHISSIMQPWLDFIRKEDKSCRKLFQADDSNRRIDPLRLINIIRLCADVTTILIDYNTFPYEPDSEEDEIPPRLIDYTIRFCYQQLNIILALLAQYMIRLSVLNVVRDVLPLIRSLSFITANLNNHRNASGLLPQCAFDQTSATIDNITELCHHIKRYFNDILARYYRDQSISSIEKNIGQILSGYLSSADDDTFAPELKIMNRDIKKMRIKKQGLAGAISGMLITVVGPKRAALCLSRDTYVELRREEMYYGRPVDMSLSSPENDSFLCLQLHGPDHYVSATGEKTLNSMVKDEHDRAAFANNPDNALVILEYSSQELIWDMFRLIWDMFTMVKPYNKERMPIRGKLPVLSAAEECLLWGIVHSLSEQDKDKRSVCWLLKGFSYYLSRLDDLQLPSQLNKVLQSQVYPRLSQAKVSSYEQVLKQLRAKLDGLLLKGPVIESYSSLFQNPGFAPAQPTPPLMLKADGCGNG